MVAQWISRFFRLPKHGTAFRQDILAGLVTFMAIAYIIIAKSAILKAAGIPYEACLEAAIISAAFGCLIMGAYANRPFAIASNMGENAFVAHTVVGGLFLIALLFSPLFSSILTFATGPALIIVGLMMLEPITRLNFSDYAEVIPSFTVIAMMSFTYNIGFVLWPVFVVVHGRIRAIPAACWALFTLCLAFFVFYPY